MVPECLKDIEVKRRFPQKAGLKEFVEVPRCSLQSHGKFNHVSGMGAL